MMIITESRFEICDRRTTLSLFMKKKRIGAKSAMNLANSRAYESLCWKIDTETNTSYEALTGRQKSEILYKFLPLYGPEKYWRLYLGGPPNSSLAWSEGLPIWASIKRRIEVISPKEFTAKISTIPTVVLFPFGWSAWLSFRITGEHTLTQLARLVKYMSEDSAFTVSPDRSSSPPGSHGTSLKDVLDLIARGMRDDVFLGEAARVHEASQLARITTVIAKHQGSPSPNDMSNEDESDIRMLLRPTGRKSGKKFERMIYDFGNREDLDYIAFDGLSRFLWMEHLLKPEGRDRQHLLCYHRNSLVALLQAWQFEGLLQACSTGAIRSKPLQELGALALRRLQKPSYVNASLFQFLDRSRESISAYGQSTP